MEVAVKCLTHKISEENKWKSFLFLELSSQGFCGPANTRLNWLFSCLYLKCLLATIRMLEYFSVQAEPVCMQSAN